MILYIEGQFLHVPRVNLGGSYVMSHYIIIQNDYSLFLGSEYSPDGEVEIDEEEVGKLLEESTGGMGNTNDAIEADMISNTLRESLFYDAGG